MVLSSAGADYYSLPKYIVQKKIREVVEENPNTIQAAIKRRMDTITRQTSSALEQIYNAKSLTQQERDDEIIRRKREEATDAEYQANTDNFKEKVRRKLP